MGHSASNKFSHFLLKLVQLLAQFEGGPQSCHSCHMWLDS